MVSSHVAINFVIVGIRTYITLEGSSGKGLKDFEGRCSKPPGSVLICPLNCIATPRYPKFPSGKISAITAYAHKFAPIYENHSGFNVKAIPIAGENLDCGNDRPITKSIQAAAYQIERASCFDPEFGQERSFRSHVYAYMIYLCIQI